MKFEEEEGHISFTVRIINTIAMELVQAWQFNTAIIHIFTPEILF